MPGAADATEPMHPPLPFQDRQTLFLQEMLCSERGSISQDIIIGFILAALSPFPLARLYEAPQCWS